ncbi:hypothetical protein CPB86DRAFT_802057 [Serendipita vermifera]|nr:hypothetical protein CPB86DRAFT_802057 [Serendipita vermifera]
MAQFDRFLRISDKGGMAQFTLSCRVPCVWSEGYMLLPAPLQPAFLLYVLKTPPTKDDSILLMDSPISSSSDQVGPPPVHTRVRDYTFIGSPSPDPRLPQSLKSGWEVGNDGAFVAHLSGCQVCTFFIDHFNEAFENKELSLFVALHELTRLRRPSTSRTLTPPMESIEHVEEGLKGLVCTQEGFQKAFQVLILQSLMNTFVLRKGMMERGGNLASDVNTAKQRSGFIQAVNTLVAEILGDMENGIFKNLDGKIKDMATRLLENLSPDTDEEGSGEAMGSGAARSPRNDADEEGPREVGGGAARSPEKEVGGADEEAPGGLEEGTPTKGYDTIWEELMVTLPGATAEDKIDYFHSRYWDPRHKLLRAELKRVNPLLPAQRHFLYPPEKAALLIEWYQNIIQRPLALKLINDRFKPDIVETHFRLYDIFTDAFLEEHWDGLLDAVQSDGWPDCDPSVPVEVPFPRHKTPDPHTIQSHLVERCKWTLIFVTTKVRPYFEETKNNKPKATPYRPPADGRPQNGGHYRRKARSPPTAPKAVREAQRTNGSAARRRQSPRIRR